MLDGILGSTHKLNLAGLANPIVGMGMKLAAEQRTMLDGILGATHKLNLAGPAAVDHLVIARTRLAQASTELVAGPSTAPRLDGALVLVNFCLYSCVILDATEHFFPELLAWTQMVLGVVGAELVRELRSR